ncbi:IscS subfamily cysteine desulfurase [Rickettsiales endosymbiont of Peranema trichophorum]|uniref:IscS subfamily cysteine desulfurase n=1 Tax=Rickettsiales endosymbiont of Peranema trichophorum TaxID=2486577 RepID=UPI001022EECA|nr:IscS subfamily cysteine desulfurase [Rickettsiales endosymbiont of Peranema trichophorum]RZI47759.1 IscS subfamily cysteine desulfurase [Rickettsiales endosymbiont of Peranema trichophorum]
MNSAIKNEKLPIYMDYQATTPVDPRVLEAMLPYFCEKFGNPHSRNHKFGWDAEEAVEVARKKIANVINANTKDIIFTSGATESNNLALKGVAHFYRTSKNHIITVQTEHKCILDTCKHLEQEGFKVTYLPVEQNGIINLKTLEDTITSDTVIVSVMGVNNEIGVIQPLAEIGELCRKNGVFFHTDAAQAFGKVPIDVVAMKIDLLSVSGHKIYGPKGIGALYVNRNPRVRLEAIINGGGQERGMRSGTLPTPLIVGFGVAAEISQSEMIEEDARLRRLSNKFISAMKQIPEVYLNGDVERRIPGNINLSFSCIEGESMIGAIGELAVSSGSACTSSSLEPSYVLRALGIDEELAHTSIRFGIGRFTTEEEIDYAINVINQAVGRLRELSPLWEMLQDGVDLKSIKWKAH